MGYKIAISRMAIYEKIPYGAPIWGEFNASFENRELELHEIANEIYLAHPFTTWHKNNWRNSANYEIGQHIALDFDSEDQRSTLQFLAKDKFIQKYAAFIYTTPSHKPEAPRARVLFVLDQPIHQAKNYTAAVSALLWLFGTADRQCKDPCRFFYGSHNCDFEWMDNVLPIEKVKQVIGQYQATGAIVKQSHERKSYTPTADQQEVADALKKIPAWGIDYDQWVSVLMAIHQAYGDNGLSLAASWADGKDGEIERKWRSFKQNGNESGAVTLNTVFKMAYERGWNKAA